MKKERLQWIDNMRGLAVVLVLLNHAPRTNIMQLTLLSMFMIPSFFLISGYLTKYDGTGFFNYFYNRVLKLLFVYVVYVFLLPFLTVTEIIKVVYDPSIIIEKIMQSGKDLVLGKPMWFLACLIIVNIIFMTIRKISKSNIALLTMSIILACAGFVVSFVLGEGIRPWSADTALVCQLFFTLGYILRDVERPEWYKDALVKGVITGIVYIVAVVISGYLFDFSNVAINVATNNWGKVWITIPLVSLCLFSGLCSSRILTRLKLFPFWGQNSLLYFAIGNHGMSVMNRLFGIIYNKYGFGVLSNRALINPIIAVSGAVILVPACWIVNKYAPFFNGRYKMPNIKKVFVFK